MAFLAPNMSLQSEFWVHFLVVVLSRVVWHSVLPGAHSSAKDWVVHNVPNIIGITSNNFFIISLVWVFYSGIILSYFWLFCKMQSFVWLTFLFYCFIICI